MSPTPTTAGGLVGLLVLALCGVPGARSAHRRDALLEELAAERGVVLEEVALGEEDGGLPIDVELTDIPTDIPLGTESLKVTTGDIPSIDESGDEHQSDAGVALVGGVGVSGRVVDDWSDSPVVDATISIGKRKTRTNLDGAFELQHVALGELTLRVAHTDYGSTANAMAIERPPYGNLVNLDEIRLAPRGRIEGQVRDALGEPVIEAEVCWGDPPSWETATKTDASGRYVLNGVKTGLQKVWARHSVAGEVSRGLVTVRPQETSPGIFLRLPRVLESR